MENRVKCRICGEQISYKADRVKALGQHLMHNHPDMGLSHFSLCDENGNQVRSDCSRHTSRSNKMFKTTVETWHAGMQELSCPYCNAKGPPLIRKQRNKVAKSSLGAICLLGCWPLCFLPFILGGGDVMNLYCGSCGKLLGKCNRKLRKYTPVGGPTSTSSINICFCDE